MSNAYQCGAPCHGCGMSEGCACQVGGPKVREVKRYRVITPGDVIDFDRVEDAVLSASLSEYKAEITVVTVLEGWQAGA